MKTPVRSTIDPNIIPAAVEQLRKGELVAFPTETVYGLGADASNEKALQKLYNAKGRPTNHPVIVHLASAEQLNDWGAEISDYALVLAKQFWPGPLTLIVKKLPHVSNQVTGGQNTVGLRIPNHPIALSLLKEFGGGVAAPSANKYGRVSATSAEHVRQEFSDHIALIIDGGSCSIGIESTIIDTTGPLPKILRPGIISEEEIFHCLNLNQSSNLETKNQSTPIRVPGSDKIHYAPRTPLFVMDKGFIQALVSDQKSSLAILSFTAIDQLPQSFLKKYIQASTDPAKYAQELYHNLRVLDASGADKILVESTPHSRDWLAIADRLSRAASK